MKFVKRYTRSYDRSFAEFGMDSRVHSSDHDVGSLCANIARLTLGRVLGAFEHAQDVSGQLNTLDFNLTLSPAPERNKILESIPNSRTRIRAREMKILLRACAPRVSRTFFYGGVQQI